MTKLIDKLQKFNQIQDIINYNVTGLTSKQYNQVYLELCNKYSKVEPHADLSLFKDKIIGYISCK